MSGTAIVAAATDAAAEIEELRRLVKKREAELDDMQGDLDRAEEDARNFERLLDDAIEKLGRMEHLEDRAKPSRPDVKRMDACDWTHASNLCVCQVCGFQYWEHATVPGYTWIHRICDGRLVKL